jgi:hypothetical protein
MVAGLDIEPGAAVIAISVALAIRALFFGDGGILALLTPRAAELRSFRDRAAVEPVEGR